MKNHLFKNSDKMPENEYPSVTVYITNFNYGRFLKQSIQSVLDQTLQDFELIVIDDGSTDDSRQIVEEFESRNRIYAVFQENKGLNVSNNIALRIARGRYVMRLDADDYLDPRALEIMVSTLDRRPEVALVFPDYYLVDEQGNVIEQVRRHNFEKDVSLFDQPAHGACTMIRRDIVRAVGGYDESFSRQDGYDLWLKIIYDYPVQNVNLPLFYYRQHSKSLTRDEARLLKTRSEIKAKHVQKRKMKPLSILTVIPVRGSSADPRSLPLAPLGDRCLIDWTVQAALDSEHVNDILVTTPDYQVQEYIRTNYASPVAVVQRNAELARINTRIEDTIIDTLSVYTITHDPPDAILVLYVEAPFRSAIYIDKAVHTMQLFDVDVVDGVRPDDSLFYVHNGQGLQPWQSEGGLRLERTDLFRRVGGLHLIRRDFLEKAHKMIGGKVGHIVLDQRAALFIKSELDWQFARFLIEKGG